MKKAINSCIHTYTSVRELSITCFSVTYAACSGEFRPFPVSLRFVLFLSATGTVGPPGPAPDTIILQSNLSKVIFAMYFNIFCVLAVGLGLCTQSFADDSSSIVSWMSTIYLDGVTLPGLATPDQTIVIKTAATFLNITTKYITYKGQSAATEVNGKFQIAAKLYSSAPLSSTIYSSGQAFWGNSTAALTDAVNTGDFDSLLQANAAAAGNTNLATASAFPVEFTDPVVSDPVAAKEEEDLGLTEGGVAIIVICALMIFFVVMYMAWDMSHNSHGAKHNDPANPKGYVLSDEEEITVNKL